MDSGQSIGPCMCFVSIVSFYYLSSSLSSGLGPHCSFLSWIHPLSMPWEWSCDGFWLKVGLCRCSVSMVSFYDVSVSLISANSFLHSIQFPRSVSVVPDLSVQYQRCFHCHCFRFVALAFILQRSRSCRLRFFVFHLVSVATSQ